MLNILRKLHRDKRGVTGLETAIILIAFVVVASVFAYTVLSAGIFSSEKGKEAINSGLKQARGTAEIKGSVVAKDTDDDADVDQVVFTLANALDGEPIDLTAPADANSDGLADDASTNVTVISYVDEDVRVDDVAWTMEQLGRGDDDNILEPGEKFQITVSVKGAGAGQVDEYHTFGIEVKPPKGSILTVEKTTPAVIDEVMVLR